MSTPGRKSTGSGGHNPFEKLQGRLAVAEEDRDRYRTALLDFMTAALEYDAAGEKFSEAVEKLAGLLTEGRIDRFSGRFPGIRIGKVPHFLGIDGKVGWKVREFAAPYHVRLPHESNEVRIGPGTGGLCNQSQQNRKHGNSHRCPRKSAEGGHDL